MQTSLLNEELSNAVALASAAALRGSPGHYDELRGRLSQAGAQEPALAPLWRRFFEAGGTEGWLDLAARREGVRRRILEDGATYNVYAPGEDSLVTTKNQADAFRSVTIYLHAESWLQLGTELRREDGELAGAYWFREFVPNPKLLANQFTAAAMKK